MWSAKNTLLYIENDFQIALKKIFQQKVYKIMKKKNAKKAR